MSGLFCLAQNPLSSLYCGQYCGSPFLRLNNIIYLHTCVYIHKHTVYLLTHVMECVHMFYSIFIHLLTDELLGCFQFLASVTNAERESRCLDDGALVLVDGSTEQISRALGLSCFSLGIPCCSLLGLIFFIVLLGLLFRAYNSLGVRMLHGSGLPTLVISDSEPLFMQLLGIYCLYLKMYIQDDFLIFKLRGFSTIEFSLYI